MCTIEREGPIAFLPDELTTHALGFLEAKELLLCCRVSHAIRACSLYVIASDTKQISTFCSMSLQRQSIEILEQFLKALSQIRPDIETPITLTIDSRYPTYANAASLRMISTYFPIRCVRCIGQKELTKQEHLSGRRRFQTNCPELPSSVEELEIDDVYFSNLAAVCKQMRAFKSLTVKNCTATQEQEIVEFNFPKTFQNLDNEGINYTHGEGVASTAISLYYKAGRNLALQEPQIEVAVALLEKSLAILPKFTQVKLQLATLLFPDMRSFHLLREVIQDEPENPIPLAMLGRFLEERGDRGEASFYVEKAIKIASRRNCALELLKLAEILKLPELVDRAYIILDRSRPVEFLLQELEEVVRVDPGHLFARLELVTIYKSMKPQCIMLDAANIRNEEQRLCAIRLQEVMVQSHIEENLAAIVAIQTVLAPSPSNLTLIARLCKLPEHDESVKRLFASQSSPWGEIVLFLKKQDRDAKPLVRYLIYTWIRAKQFARLESLYLILQEEKLFSDLQEVAVSYLKIK